MNDDEKVAASLLLAAIADIEANLKIAINHSVKLDTKVSMALNDDNLDMMMADKLADIGLLVEKSFQVLEEAEGELGTLKAWCRLAIDEPEDSEATA